MSKKNTVIADILKSKKLEVADIFASSLYLSPRWKNSLDTGKSNGWNTYLKEQFYAYVDYLALYFESNNETYKSLFLGEKLKSLHAPDLEAEARQALAKQIQAKDEEALEQLLKSDLGEHWTQFSALLKEINILITTETTTQLNIAFVGDCLFLDIVPFIVAPLLKQGISINAEYVASKNPIDARDDLKKLSNKKIDLIFFSPFTYDYSPKIVDMIAARNVLISQKEVINTLETCWVETEKTIALIADLFDCPAYVHNASFIVRDDNEIKRAVKLKLTARTRHLSKEWINEKLTQCLESINQSSFRHLFIFDESAQIESISEFQAGAHLYNSPLQHPSVLGMEFAKPYIDIIYAHTKLNKKKLVVCDLDNTVWDGVIGEGAVEHFHDRQTILKGLRNKGIVLAINSKNDPKNVHWTNGTLNENDFVYEAINWQPKIQNMAKIPDELNLKINSFVFIDDRADEVEMMQEAFPDVLCLNATDATSWQRLAVWENTLEDNQDMDRTLMYQQREQRKEFVKEEVTSDEDRLAMFASLDLKLIIKKPEQSEVKRTTELINRTNQFNLEGTRVSLKDMTDWYSDDKFIMLSARTSDRFGDMGVTCVTVGQLVNDEFTVIAFVLSCRVFGYQFEHSVMNHLKKLAKDAGAKTMKATYTATAVNAPCKSFLPDNGFIKDGEHFYFDLNTEAQADAAWITVET